MKKWSKTGRNKAEIKNLKTFYTGKLCSRGHDARRYTSNGACVECIKIYTANAIEKKRRKFSVWIYAADIPVLQKYAESLNLARELNFWIDGNTTSIKKK